MTNDEERALARKIQSSLHGATLASGGGWRTGLDNPRYLTQGVTAPGMGFGQSSDYVPEKHSLKAQQVTSPLPDSERMIQYLDALTVQARDLSTLAESKLDQFCDYRPAAECDPLSKTSDNRQCSSSYFRILESRIEMLQESFNHLSSLLHSVSASSQGDSIQKPSSY